MSHITHDFTIAATMVKTVFDSALQGARKEQCWMFVDSSLKKEEQRRITSAARKVEQGYVDFQNRQQTLLGFGGGKNQKASTLAAMLRPAKIRYNCYSLDHLSYVCPLKPPWQRSCQVCGTRCGSGGGSNNHAMASTSSLLDMLVDQMARVSAALADLQSGSSMR